MLELKLEVIRLGGAAPVISAVDALAALPDTAAQPTTSSQARRFPRPLAEWQRTAWFPIADVVGKYPDGRADLRYRLMPTRYTGPRLRLTGTQPEAQHTAESKSDDD
jgi:hypothetical protein